MSRNKFAVARRSIWYMLRLLLMTALVFSLAFCVFVSAMYVSNIYIILTEGMELRAECVLKDTVQPDLTEYFSEAFVASDAALYAEKYSGYTVTNFDYRIQIEKLFVWPWSGSVRVRVTDKVVNIAGTANDESGSADSMPVWEPAQQEVTLVKVGTRWYIHKVELLQLNPPEDALPTPDMSLLEGDATS